MGDRRRGWRCFAKRLGSQLTLVASLEGSPVGFASLASGGR